MEFNEKLQNLRKSRGLTQDELANSIFVSRAAISKWESGRGYPNIDSLKAISEYFSVTVDELLSGNELLTLAENNLEKESLMLRDRQFGLFDISMILLLFLPLFRMKTDSEIHAVSLMSLSGISNYLTFTYYLLLGLTILWGIFMLTTQNCDHPFWRKCKIHISIGLCTAGVLLFIVSMQPYAAVFSFIFLAMKVFLIRKN